MTPKVFDSQGNPQTWDWLKTQYKCDLLEAPPGTAFRLVRIDEMADASARGTASAAVWIVQVHNEAGGAQPIQPVANHWPGVESDEYRTDLRGKGLKSLWFNFGIVQNTDMGGTTGFGYGAGSVIHEGGGPHTLWVLSPTYPSDALTKVGWLGGTDHFSPGRLTFQIVTDTPTPDPDPEPEPGGTELARIVAATERTTSLLERLVTHLGA
jgi:hypothetical protein